MFNRTQSQPRHFHELPPAAMPMATKMEVSLSGNYPKSDVEKLQFVSDQARQDSNLKEAIIDIVRDRDTISRIVDEILRYHTSWQTSHQDIGDIACKEVNAVILKFMPPESDEPMSGYEALEQMYQQMYEL